MACFDLAHGTRGFATPTDSVAAARSNVAPEIFRAMIRTVLIDHTAASSSMNRGDDTSDADARLPARAPLTVTSISDVAPGARLGRFQDTSAANSRCPDCGSSGVPFSTAGAASGKARVRAMLDRLSQSADSLLASCQDYALPGLGTRTRKRGDRRRRRTRGGSMVVVGMAANPSGAHQARPP